MTQKLVTRYVAATNFSRRQSEYDGEPPFIWANEDVSQAQIDAIGWTADEIELYVAMGALAVFEEWIDIPDPAPKLVKKQEYNNNGAAT